MPWSSLATGSGRLLEIRDPRYLDHVLVATEPRRYGGPLYGTVVAEHKPPGQEPLYAVVLDEPLLDGTCLLMPVRASRLVVIR